MMKKEMLHQSLRVLTLLFVAGLALASCVKSEPKQSEDETKHKLHEDPVKAVFTLTEASLEASKELTYQHLSLIRMGTETQTITFAQEKGAAFVRTADSPESFRVKTALSAPNAVYHLAIKYYNKAGQLMNNQFIDNEQYKIHQHFFSVYKNKRLVSKIEEIPYSYIYADKYADGRYFPENNPIGMEGFFRFKQGFVQQKVSADLIHFFKSKYDEETGQLGTYYAPIRKLKSQSDMDVSLELNFVEDNH